MAVSSALTQPVLVHAGVYVPLGSVSIRYFSLAQWRAVHASGVWVGFGVRCGRASVNVPTAEVYEGTRPVFVARVLDAQGVPVVSGDLSGVGSFVVYREGDETESAVYTDSSVATSSFNSSTALTVDGFWTADFRGYNFKYTVPSITVFPEGGESYLCQFSFPTTSAGPVVFEGRIRTRSVVAT